MKKEQNLPRPTVEQLNEYDQLSAKLSDSQLQGAAYDEVINKLNDLISSYNWDNYEFVDPVTGKKGVKNAAGQILVPADFDDFTFLGDHHVFNLPHLAAKKDGKYGVVAADGTGNVLADFRFDVLIWCPYTAMYQACWDGVKGKFGFVTKYGKVFIPNILTQFYEPWNDFILLEADGNSISCCLSMTRLIGTPTKMWSSTKTESRAMSSKTLASSSPRTSSRRMRNMMALTSTTPSSTNNVNYI